RAARSHLHAGAEAVLRDGATDARRVRRAVEAFRRRHRPGGRAEQGRVGAHHEPRPRPPPRCKIEYVSNALSSPVAVNRKMGKVLLTAHVITPEQYEAAMKEVEGTPDRIEDVVIFMSF